MTSYVDGNEKVFLLDDNDELVGKYDYPTVSGYWVLDGKTFVTIDIADIPTTDGLIVFVASDRRGVVKLPTKSVYRPYANLTFQQVSNQVDALSAAQLRQLVAWLVWINRDSITEDFSKRLT